MTVHADQTIAISRLIQALERGRMSAIELGRAVLVSVVEPCPPVDPIAVCAAAETYRDRSLWFQPESGFALVGVGSAYAVEEQSNRFSDARSARQTLLTDAIVEEIDSELRATGPVLLGGFSFDPRRQATDQWRCFPSTRLILPRVLLTARPETCYVTLNVMVGPDSDSHEEALRLSSELEHLMAEASRVKSTPKSEREVSLHEARQAWDWQRVVADASSAIRRGDAQKIVLAREIDLVSSTSFAVSAVLDRLAQAYPTCYVFAFGHGEQTFLGATPERLVRLEDGELRTAGLAGSERRGTTPEEDQALGASLLASNKDRAEHAIVVHALREGLSELCEQLISPDEPELLSVSNVHHLYTPIVGHVREGVCILDAVERLHPTPAVGGYPREIALEFIREHEGMDRGWYASPVGWVGADGGGEFAVALRSALIDGTQAFLFAGCGIMGDSDPQREYDESWLKFRPMLGALGGETR